MARSLWGIITAALRAQACARSSGVRPSGARALQLAGAEQREIEPHAVEKLAADVDLDRETPHHPRGFDRLCQLDAPRPAQ